MKNYYGRVLFYEILGILVIFVLGYVWHSLYSVFDYNPIVGLFSPINESPWEHIKIIFFPWWLYAILEYPLVKFKINNYFFSKSIGVIVFQIVTLGVVYVVECFTGSHSLIFTIIMYLTGLSLGVISSYYLLTNLCENSILEKIGLILFLIEFFIIFIFTINPPRLDYFKDVKAGTFGIYGYR
ncbi:DUF6512 family protein [Vallitalea okinawensis]|uniref:DUF6512 family protein n=1 Tax=Vallitalea okinawensis TaxID=2078660 RepID=UPI000CFD312C|nr:DUF6512 family protein [Vallitalea okinawensis]